MTVVTQRSFSGGELAPSLYARVDTRKYATGLRTGRNGTIKRDGGFDNRPGSLYVAEVKDSSKSVRLIPFIFNDEQTYVLEFGDQYMRVHRNGVQLTDIFRNIANISNAFPGIVTSAVPHGYSDGDELNFFGVLGMTELNGRAFIVTNSTASTFELYDKEGNPVNTISYNTFVLGGAGGMDRVYEIPTPYLEGDLQDLQFVQSADVVTIVNKNYAPRDLSRTGNTSWSLDEISFKPTATRPTSLSASGTAGSTIQKYIITAIDAETGEESLAGISTGSVAITGITQASPAVATTAGHSFVEGDQIHIKNVVGMTEVNDRTYVVGNTAVNTYELRDLNGNDIDSTGYGAYTSGGNAHRFGGFASNVIAPSASNPVTVSWSLVSSASEYNVYKESNGYYGLIGIAIGSSFKDVGQTVDTSTTYPKDSDIFLALGDWPATVNYIQQRKGYANTTNDPEKVWLSRTGQYTNFTSRTPLQDDDKVEFTLAGRQVNEVRHLLEAGKLLILTSGAEHSINGNESGVITPTGINRKTHSYRGSSSVRPLILDGDIFYIQSRGSKVRSLGFDFQVEGYRGNDLSIFSSHLFDGYSIVDWDYQETPNSVIWVVRSDGTLLSLTYVREQEMLAWTRHDFEGGEVENVVSVPSGNEDAVYVIVKRTINGVTRRYIEYFSTRLISDSKDMVFMDSALSYDGRNTGSSTMTLSGGTTWAYDEDLTLTSPVSTFRDTDIGNQIHLKTDSGDYIRCTITIYTNVTTVTVRPHKTVPTELRNTATTEWIKAVDELIGLWHLEGKDVSILGDALVVASPNNASYDTVTVSGGKITLDKAYGVIHVGLPYLSDLETLDVDTPSGETVSDKHMNLTGVTMEFEKTRGVWVGFKPPEDDSVDPLEDMTEFKLRKFEDYDSPVSLLTDKADLNIQSQWNSNGRVFVRQVDPLPMSILAISPSGWMPFRK